MLEDLKFKPTDYSYRVDSNVWAGEYPVWEWGQGAGMQQLRLFTDFGINYFVDLSESGELPPYSSFLPNGVSRYSLPIPNGCAPADAGAVVEMFRTLQEVLTAKPETRFYIHCVGGVGRTGTIVACYYIYFHHLSADDALALMRNRYAYHGRSPWISAPESEEQLNFINAFADCCV